MGQKVVYTPLSPDGKRSARYASWWILMAVIEHQACYSLNRCGRCSLSLRLINEALVEARSRVTLDEDGLAVLDALKAIQDKYTIEHAEARGMTLEVVQ